MAGPAVPIPAHTPSDGGVTAIVLSVVFTSLATVMVGLRFYVRQTKRAAPFLEDWLILAALVLLWSYVAIVFLLAFDGGLGWGADQTDPQTLLQAGKYSLAGQTTWPIANGLIKVSICLTFIRIFFTRTFRIVATIVYILCIGWSVATILVGYLICTPTSFLWTDAPGGRCGNTSAAYVSLGVLDVVLDMAVFSLPLPMLYNLQVAKKAKIALMATFGLGLFTIVAGIMRLVAVIQLDYQANFTEGETTDAYWCSVEAAVGIVVACTMTLRPLLERLHTAFRKYFGQISGLGTGQRSSGLKPSTNDSEALGDNASFMRLHDGHPEPPLELPLQKFQGFPKHNEKGNHTKRESMEYV